jgi:hypothetical protein
MNESDIRKDSQQAVGELLNQYNDYLKVVTVINELKSQQMATALRLASSSGSHFTLVLKENPSEIKEIGVQITDLEERLQSISDEMTFASPIVWVMYKFQAYAGTSQAIVDMEDFRGHCQPDGYICTKRYLFVKNYLLKNMSLDLDDTSQYPDTLKLDQLYLREEFFALVTDKDFMSSWNTYEYHRVNGKVAKWENYSECSP